MARLPRTSNGKGENFQAQDEIVLGLLTAIDQDAQISQRTISRELDVALGLANAYLKRCVRKGFIKIQQIPSRRYTYYLTPKGFAEKARLAGEYFSASFTFFRRARSQMSDLMQVCSRNGWRRIAFYGASDLAEVGSICVRDHGVELVGIIDPKYPGESFSGLKVRASIADLGEVDVVIVTTFTDAAAVFEMTRGILPDERVLAPSLTKFVLRETGKDATAHMATE
jgi:DNA-binding MarR family transcriptional regulator